MSLPLGEPVWDNGLLASLKDSPPYLLKSNWLSRNSAGSSGIENLLKPLLWCICANPETLKILGLESSAGLSDLNMLESRESSPPPWRHVLVVRLGCGRKSLTLPSSSSTVIVMPLAKSLREPRVLLVVFVMWVALRELFDRKDPLGDWDCSFRMFWWTIFVPRPLLDSTPPSFMTLFLRVRLELRIECLFLESVDLLGIFRFDLSSPSEALMESSVCMTGICICMSRSSLDQWLSSIKCFVSESRLILPILPKKLSRPPPSPRPFKKLSLELRLGLFALNWFAKKIYLLWFDFRRLPFWNVFTGILGSLFII